jgi:hypothetical protein
MVDSITIALNIRAYGLQEISKAFRGQADADK